MKYQPSNGTEGMDFMEEYCFRCQKDAKFQETGDGEDGCPIVAKTFLYNVDDPEYPEEWTFTADGQPTCTAFKEN